MNDQEPGLERTEVGIIPEEWKVRILSRIGAPDRPAIKAGPFGSSLTKNTYVSSGYKIYGQEQVIAGDPFFGDYFISHKKYMQLFSCSVRPGDILMSLVGTAGRVLKIPSDAAEGIINPRLVRLSPDASRFSSDFLAFYLAADAFQSALVRGAQGGTMGVLNSTTLGSIPLPEPPLSEQKAIAKALGIVDELIASLEALITKKCNIKQGATQELFSGQRRLPGFKGKWSNRILGNIAGFHRGSGLPKSALSDDGAHLCVHYGELFTYYGPVINLVRSRTWLHDGVLSKNGDVLMPTSDVTPTGLAKASCLKIEGVIIGGDTMIIRPIASELDGAYLALCIRHREADVLKLVSGSTVYHLYPGPMRKFEFFAPDVHEQKEIARFLHVMDAEIAALEAKLAKSRDLKQGMMQVLLTGEVRLA